jgi:chromosome segregation ATPase
MEKSTSRVRRNAAGSESTRANRNVDESRSPSAETPVAAAPTSARGKTTLTAGQKAKQRIENAVNAPIPEKASPAGLGDTFVDERNDVLAVINELEDQLDRHQEIRETLERELTKRSEDLQGASTKVQELEWQVVTLQTRVDALEQVRQQAAVLEEELSDATARVHRVKEQLVSTEKERARLKNELKAATKQVDELWAVRKERDGLRSDYKSLSIKVEELERNQREMFEERGQLQSEIQELQASLDEVGSERNQLQSALRGMEDRIRELVQVQDALTDKVDSLRSEKKSLQVQMTHLERENTRLIEQRQFYECEVTSLRNQNRTVESALTSVKKAFGEVRVALTETKSRARRRAVDTWPRIGSTLRPDAGEVVATGQADADDLTASGEPLDAEQLTEQIRETVTRQRSTAGSDRSEKTEQKA